MGRTTAVIGTAAFLLVPLTVGGFVPWWISRGTAHIEPGWFWQTIGALLLAFGCFVLLDSFVRFAWQGLGTPAPVLPTKRLVVSGLYRHVRNPMYVAVLALILGQSLLYGSARALVYGVVIWLCFQLFVSRYEEPTLRRTYGAEYETFCTHVPRWIPRLHPWRPDSESG